MAGPPSEVLSQHVRTLLSGRRVRSAVFMSFTLEPEFFETEIVPLLAGDHLIQEPRMRLLQLEEELRGAIGPVAVYYDPTGLRPDGSKRLDIRYVPVRLPSGVFHPKMLLFLTESADPEAPPDRTLICGVLSANLTKRGWWSSLECAHFELVREGDRCGFRDDLVRFLGEVRRLGGVPADHEALALVADWLRRNTTQAQHATDRGRLRTRLAAGTQPLVDFLREARGPELTGASLEIVAPFLDESRPAALESLVEAFDVRETRIFLPTAVDGTAAVSEDIYRAVRQLTGCVWSRIPQDLLKLGKDSNAQQRGVHAKVYRFIRKSARYEAIVVGSHNLTVAAHGRGRNIEASFFIEREDPGPIDWWLSADAKKPLAYVVDETDEDLPAQADIPLQLSYDWVAKSAKALWEGKGRSVGLSIESGGSRVFTLDALTPGEWTEVGADDAAKLEGILSSATLLEAITEDGQRGAILVQEYGMSRKPSLIATWSIADVLEYWSRLTPEQRAAFLEERGGNIPEGIAADGSGSARLVRMHNFFSSAAGIFHGFEMLRKQVLHSLDDGHDKQADYLLFGKRHDSLPSLIAKATSDEGEKDCLGSYLLLLSARHLLKELRPRRHEFFRQHRDELDELAKLTKHSRVLAERLDLGDGGKAFLKWFETHFLRNLRRHEATNA
jgi:hypothetical protein